ADVGEGEPDIDRVGNIDPELLAFEIDLADVAEHAPIVREHRYAFAKHYFEVRHVILLASQVSPCGKYCFDRVNDTSGRATEASPVSARRYVGLTTVSRLQRRRDNAGEPRDGGWCSLIA